MKDEMWIDTTTTNLFKYILNLLSLLCYVTDTQIIDSNLFEVRRFFKIFEKVIFALFIGCMNYILVLRWKLVLFNRPFVFINLLLWLINISSLWIHYSDIQWYKIFKKEMYWRNSIVKRKGGARYQRLIECVN